MTIYTTAARVAQHNVCEGGQERTAAALAREGKTMDTRVTMQNILRSLGLTDALYSFAEVEPASAKEAQTTLRAYMRALAGVTSNLILVREPIYGVELAIANKPLNKRCDGIYRPHLLRKEWVRIANLRKGRIEPEMRYWLQAYMDLLSPKHDYMAATHATVAFLEGAKAAGIYGEALHTATNILAELLGPDPEYTTPEYEEGVSNEEGW